MSASSTSWVSSVRVAIAVAYSPFLRQPKNAGDARVRILDVVDGVLGGLLPRQLQVELHLALGRAGQEEVAAGVRAHLLHKLAQRDQIARALGDPHHLGAPLQRHYLVDYQGPSLSGEIPRAADGGAFMNAGPAPGGRLPSTFITRSNFRSRNLL